MKNGKKILVDLPATLAQDLERVARANNMPKSAIMRISLTRLINSVGKDLLI